MIFFIAAGSALCFALYEKHFSSRVYPGVWLGSKREIALQGKTINEVSDLVEHFSEQLIRDQLTFRLEGREVKINPLVVSEDPSLSRELFSFQPKETAKKALIIGHEGRFLERLKTQWVLLTRGIAIDAEFSVDKPEIEKILLLNFSDLEKPFKLPSIKKTPDGEYAVKNGEPGTRLNIASAYAVLLRNLRALRNDTVVLTFSSVAPKITDQEAESLLPFVINILKRAPITLLSGGVKAPNQKIKTWSVLEDELMTWIRFVNVNGKASLDLDPAAIEKFLTPLAKEVRIEPEEARFTIKNGKIEEFNSSKIGQELDFTQTIERVRHALLQEDQNSFAIALKEKNPLVSLENVNTLGIREGLGIGESSFAGSPVNRRHNIKLATEKINGILIKPGEEFSLLKALGKTNEEAGYKEELVIKGNRTVPEYGGGLCQVATTLFRLALNVGLPITSRQPHSFRVRYYEPPGYDATVYDPAPDFRFVNDTKNYLLLAVRIEKNKLIFEFWGTPDGRKSLFSKTKIWGIKEPGPTQYIETEDIKEGEKKCVEKPVAGASTEFTRTIEWPDGGKQQDVWKSAYRPWPEVCLIGKKKGTNEDTNKDTNGNTNKGTDKSTNINTNEGTNKFSE